MAERMAKVEQRPIAGFHLVARNDRRLGADARLDRRRQRRAIVAEDALPIGLEPGKKLRVAEKPVLGDFGIPGPHLAWGQRRQHGGIGDDEARLMKDADQVFALRRVDAGFAADGTVDLREQRRRDLNEAHAATQDARRKTGKIADDAAAERHDKIAAFEAKL